jgi:hypothetical protein
MKPIPEAELCVLKQGQDGSRGCRERVRQEGSEGPGGFTVVGNRDMSLGTVHVQETVRGRAVYNFKEYCNGMSISQQANTSPALTKEQVSSYR